MSTFSKLLCWCMPVVAISLLGDAAVMAEELMQLTENGKTAYVIVIGSDAVPAEQFAARELAEFLKQMTGVEFPILRDDALSSDYEIVLGNTNRLSLADVPADLQPNVREGFVLYRQGSKLFILGQIPRATLYGVYDFLEIELGVRFLTADVTHVPQKPTLAVDVRSRKYDSPLESRQFMYKDATWGVRNRLNSAWGFVPMEDMLGGVRWVGPSFCHTFGYLVSGKQYFKDHPEYFSLVKGERIRSDDGTGPAQLCLTNPEVLKIAIASVRKWIDEFKATPEYHPDSTLIVSVSMNDCLGDCECDTCRAVNKKEGSKAGTLIRFVNGVAAAIEKDYPNVLVETLAYSYAIEPPKITKPRDNVIIRFAPLDSDCARGIDDSSSPKNRVVFETAIGWSKICDHIYVWDYYCGNNFAWFEPNPQLYMMQHNIHFYLKHGMKGLFGSISFVPNGDLIALRHYLLAKLMWRPESDGRKIIEEFCRLYYGKSSEGILEYIDLTHKTFYAQNVPLMCQGGGMIFEDAYIRRANAILNQAEQKAENEIIRKRVAAVRLAVWYVMLNKEFERAGRVFSMPEEWYFKIDPQDVGLKEEWSRSRSFDGWDRIKIDKSWTRQGYDYHGSAWYAVPFELSARDVSDQSQLSLYFGAVDGYCDIFIDGQKIGEQKVSSSVMWDKGFYISIPPTIKQGRHNLIVRVRKDKFAAGIWKSVSIIDNSRAVPEYVKEAGRRFIEVSKSVGVDTLSEYYGPRGSQLEDELYPKIRSLLTRKPDLAAIPGTIRKAASVLPNGHRTFEIVANGTSEEGWYAVQKPEKWTSGQGICWYISEVLTDAEKTGVRYRLRARVKVDKKGNDGSAFVLGYWHCAEEGRNWAGDVDDFMVVQAADVKNGQWQWYELETPVKYQKPPKGQRVFVHASDNSENISSVAVDMFELVPVE